MAADTKEKILESALQMFSEKGYSGTNMRELAESLGFTKAALYKHFESKEEIWNCIIDSVEEYYDDKFGLNDDATFVPSSVDELTSMTMNLVNFTIHDKKVVLVRKLLLTEQFHDERARKLATYHFLEGTEKMFTVIFKKMIENNFLKDDEPDMLAFEYTAPITAMIHLIDREPDRETESVRKIEAFIAHFYETHCMKEI